MHREKEKEKERERERERERTKLTISSSYLVCHVRGVCQGNYGGLSYIDGGFLASSDISPVRRRPAASN